jgi:hypothetical protein
MNSFRIEAELAHGAGFIYFDQLGARESGDGFEVWLRVINPATSEIRLIKTLILSVEDLVSGDLVSADLVSADLVSVADLWRGAVWAEEEIRVAFRRAVPPLTLSGSHAHPEDAQ